MFNKPSPLVVLYYIFGMLEDKIEGYVNAKVFYLLLYSIELATKEAAWCSG